jgi:hypothetical protein
MMQAIHTKYIPASNVKGSRIKATSDGGLSVTISYPYEFSGHLVHFQAVKALVAKHKLDWNISSMCHGDSSDGKGYTFVFSDSKV